MADQDLIFTTREGAALPHWKLSARWHPDICKGPGYDTSACTLRNTGSSILEGMGVSRSETMEALRHQRGTLTHRCIGIDINSADSTSRCLSVYSLVTRKPLTAR